MVGIGAPIKKKDVEPDTLSIDYGVCTHIGQRPHNQDEVLVTSAPGTLNGCGRLFAVADGMGGHPGGGPASHMACDRLNDYFESVLTERGKQKPSEICRQLVETVMRTDRMIRLHGQRDKKPADMGTTLSCLLITDKYGVIAHVGDSRIYRIRKGRLSCLTVDHTFVQDMIVEGEVDPDQAHLHPLRHMLTRAVGTGEPLELVDSRFDRLATGDRFLLCTDGLTNAIDEKSIHGCLAEPSTAADAAGELVNKALHSGARDNITAVVVNIERAGHNHPDTKQ